MRIFELLFRLYPVRFRARHQHEMLEMFREASSGKRGVELLRFQLGAGKDMLFGVIRERRRELRERGRLVPAIASDLLSDVTLAFRGFARSRSFATIAVATIGVGVGATASIFTVVNGVLATPLPYPDPDRIVMIFNNWVNLGVNRNSQNPGDFFDYRERTTAFESIEAIGGTGRQTLTGRGPAVRVSTIGATDGLFNILGVEPQFGRFFQESDDHNNAVISNHFWQNALGGEADAVGSIIELNGANVRVVGILPPEFRLHLPSHMSASTNIQVWLPIRRFLGAPGNRDRTAHWMNTLARLKPGVSIDEAQHEMDLVAAWQRENFTVRADRNAQIVVVGMHDEIVRETRPTILALFGAVCVVLLIACANVANLILVRSHGRRGEIAVRAALGGSRFRIFRQLLTESMVLGTLGGALGVGLTFLGIQLVESMAPANMPFPDNLTVDLRVLTFLITTSLSTVVFFGAIPAYTSSRHDITSMLGSRSAGGESKRSSRTKATLATAEVAMSVVLLFGSLLLVRSYLLLGTEDPGYQVENVMTIIAGDPPHLFSGTRAEVAEKKQSHMELVKATLQEVPGVTGVGTIWPTPLSDDGGGSSTYTDEETTGSEQSQNARSLLISPGFFDVAGIPILRGRDLTLADGGDKIVIDRRMADRMWPGENPLGKRLRVGWWSGPVWGDVVGVVENVRTETIMAPDRETIYRKAAVYGYSPSTYYVRTSVDPVEIAEQLRAAVQGVDPSAAVERMRPMREIVDEQLAPLKFVMTLIGGFATIAAALAAVGLYGVLSFSVSSRVREMGIRMACGAKANQLFGLVLNQGVRLAIVGGLLGMALAVAMSRFVHSYLYGLEALDPVSLIGVAALTGLITMIASLTPALRAAGMDPTRVLREQ